MATDNITYVLEDYWFGKWHLITTHEDKDFLEAHAKDLEERLKVIDKKVVFKYRIRKSDEE